MVGEKLSVQSLVDSICDLTLLEASEVADALKERLNIQDIPMGAMLGGGAAGANDGDATAVAAVQEEFNLILESFGEKKTQVIKDVRNIKKKESIEIGLREAKEMVETPNVKVCENLPKEKADEYLKILLDAGAKAKLE